MERKVTSDHQEDILDFGLEEQIPEKEPVYIEKGPLYVAAAAAGGGGRFWLSRPRFTYLFIYFTLVSLAGFFFVMRIYFFDFFTPFYLLSIFFLLLFLFSFQRCIFSTYEITFIVAAATFIFMESMIGSFAIKLLPVFNLISYGFLLIFYLPGFILFKKPRWYLIIVTALMQFYGLTQFYIILFRGSPMRPLDIKNIKSALAIKSDYSLFGEEGVMALLFGAVVLFSVFHLTAEEHTRETDGKKKIIGGALVIGLFVFFITQIDRIARFGSLTGQIRQWDMNRTYRRVGSLFFFLLDYRLFCAPKPPEGYSAKLAKDILSRFPEPNTTNITGLRRPNIIAIMSESFADYGFVKELKTEPDFMPFIRSLSNNTIKGHVVVAPFGGLSCNSEYEFLSGNSMGFYTPDIAAYVELANNRQETLVGHLHKLGYKTFAFAAAKRGLWNIETAYKNFGFDDCVYKDGVSDVPLWLGKNPEDDGLFKKALKRFKTKPKGTPGFMFITTMQNHAPYKEVKKPPVKVPGYDIKILESYLMGLKASDDAIKNLLTTLQKEEEDYIVVFYGDHFPVLTPFTNKFLGTRVSSTDQRTFLKLHATPFFVWSNYESKSEKDAFFSLSYLSLKVMETAGLPKSRYMQFRDSIKDKLICNQHYGYCGANNTWYGGRPKSNLTGILSEYHIVQHYMINDKPLKE